tara:strand:- start:9980 stop:10984 length:1005 start_codon:yes stop_codon:yes gene_type:complete
MTYSRIQTPRFYVDHINWLISRGVSPDQFAMATGSNLIDHDASFVDAELFDMNPSRQVVFSTSDSSGTRADHLLFVIDKQATNIATDFVAILNHNLNSANAQFFIHSSSSDITSADPANHSAAPILNATESSDIFTPTSDGDSIIELSSVTNRYVAIQIQGVSSAFSSSNDVKIGSIMIGKKFDMPISPDLNVTRNISFGNDIMETPAGKRFSQARFLEGNLSSSTQTGQPFRTKGTSGSLRFGGRSSFQMNFSFISDENLVNSDISTQSTDSTFLNDVWNRTGGSHIPFIFTPDGSSTTNGDYLFARFDQDTLSLSQVASNVFSTSLGISEEF